MKKVRREKRRGKRKEKREGTEGRVEEEIAL